jgi:superfamily II DNA or RNA helicase
MDTARLSFSGGTLVLKGIPRAQIRQTLGAGAWKWDNRVLGWRCDAIHYPVIRDRLPVSKLYATDTVPKWRPVRWTRIDIHKLRGEQQAAFDAWLGVRRGCIVMPTGTGKTEVALSIMAHTAVATLVVAPIRDLMHQWHRRILTGLGYDAGIIGDNLFRVKPVSVATYDSAYLHMDRLGDRFELIVFDECHHLPGPLRRDAAKMSAAPMRLGLTATPERSDDRHTDLSWLIGPIVYEMPIAAAKGRTLADYEVVRIPVHLSRDEQARYDRMARLVRRYVAQRREEDPDFSWDRLYAEKSPTPQARAALNAYRAKKSIEDRAEEKLRVLEDLFRLHVGEPCIVFAGSNAMARDVSRRFLIPCLLSHCGKTERRDILQGLDDGGYSAVVANRVLDEGVDLPEIKVAIVIGGTASTRQAKQRLGRVLRKSGNARARLYEVVCAETNEESRSRRRRASDAYAVVRHQRRNVQV